MCYITENHKGKKGTSGKMLNLALHSGWNVCGQEQANMTWKEGVNLLRGFVVGHSVLSLGLCFPLPKCRSTKQVSCAIQTIWGMLLPRPSFLKTLGHRRCPRGTFKLVQVLCPTHWIPRRGILSGTLSKSRQVCAMCIPPHEEKKQLRSKGGKTSLLSKRWLILQAISRVRADADSFCLPLLFSLPLPSQNVRLC